MNRREALTGLSSIVASLYLPSSTFAKRKPQSKLNEVTRLLKRNYDLREWHEARTYVIGAISPNPSEIKSNPHFIYKKTIDVKIHHKNSLYDHAKEIEFFCNGCKPTNPDAAAIRKVNLTLYDDKVDSKKSYLRIDINHTPMFDGIEFWDFEVNGYNRDSEDLIQIRPRGKDNQLCYRDVHTFGISYSRVQDFEKRLYEGSLTDILESKALRKRGKQKRITK